MTLRFDELSPREFEELCLALLRAEGHRETRHVGAAGKDKGWDLRTTDPDHRIWCVQCKNKVKVGPAEASRELAKVLKHRQQHPFDVWALMASCDLSLTSEETLGEAAGGDCVIELCGKSDLEARIREHPLIRDRFFAGDRPRARIVYLSAGHHDRDVAAALRRDLQANLRRHVGAEWTVQWRDPSQSELPEVPDAASWGLVVVSPESLADRGLLDLWRGALSQGRQHGQRRLVAVSVAPSEPWPEWLEKRFERLDLRLESQAYRTDLAAILCKWTGEMGRDLCDELDLEGPGQAPIRLPHELAERLVSWLQPVVGRQVTRRFLAMNLGLDGKRVLDGFETSALQASAAVVLSRRDDDPVQAALRLIGIVREEIGDEQSPERLQALDALEADLRKTLTPTTVDRGLRPAWLRKVRLDHERLVSFFQRRHELVLLDRVYVELEMIPDHGRGDDRLDRKMGEGKASGGQGLGIEDLLDLDPEQDPWVTRRWVVRGDPGAGKTTLLRHLACKLASDPSGRWVPIFQSMPVLLRSKQSLLDRVDETFEDATGLSGMKQVLDEEGRAGRLLVLLDGLDEVGDDRARAEARLRELSERWPQTPIVVSTRPIGYRRFSESFREVRLLPLSSARRLDFLAAWFGRADGTRDTERAGRSLHKLDASGLDELAGNPLYLTLMAMLLEQNEAPEKNRSKLYDQVFKLLLEGRHKHERIQPIERPALVRKTLCRLAHSMTVDNLDVEAVSDLVERFYGPELGDIRLEIQGTSARWEGDPRHFLDDLAEKVGILGPHDGEDADWRFWHRTFKEALTAEHLASLPEDELLQRAETLAGQESRWAEPFALLTGQVKAPDALVRQLVESNRTLGLRALATAQSVSDNTLDEILALTDNLEARSKVFEKIPALLDDAERSLKLIDRLRRRTRNGYDLFWLHRAAGEVAESSEDFAEAARALQDQFFDHIPKPDPELFRTADTAVDGPVDLWKEIPAGEGWVGSPEDEEGRDEDEGPRHRVEVVQPFRMSAVPMTHAQYAGFDPGEADLKQANHPVSGVTWYEAVSFCRWLSALPGFAGARLPTEEEWEYACRAGSTARYWSGDAESELAKVGWYAENANGNIHPVGEKPANPWGLYDMHGNVWEWTASEWKGDYSKQAEGLTVDPAVEPEDLAAPPGVGRVLRGGCFGFTAGWARSAYRVDWVPRNQWQYLGFRVLLPRPPAGGRS